MSKITDIFKQLSHGSIGAVQNGSKLNNLAVYLDEERLIESNLKQNMDAVNENGGGIVLLIGNAGDGKSHIISKLKSNYGYSDFEFYNDATASCSPTMSSFETLKTALLNFDDEHIENTNSKMLLAINLGKLNEFINEPKFTHIGTLAKQVLSESYEQMSQKRFLRFVSFSNQQNFELTLNDEEYPVEARFISKILDKITLVSDSNPFYRAYLETKDDSKFGPSYPEVINFELLSLPNIKDSIVKLIIECIVRFKLIFTPRDLFDFICSIVALPQDQKYVECTRFFESLLPSLVYGGGTSKIQNCISRLDPLRVSSLQHNKDLAELFTAFKLDYGFIAKEKLGTLYSPLKEKIDLYYSNHGAYLDRISKFIFRLNHVLKYHCETPVYSKYLKYLTAYNVSSETRRDVLIELEEMVNTCIPRHYGAYIYSADDLVPLNIQGSKYKLYAKVDKCLSESNAPLIEESRNIFLLYIPMEWIVDDAALSLRMDYQLFEYINLLQSGKLPISYESETNLEFGRFIRELIKLSSSDKEVVIISSDNNTVNLKSKLNNTVTLS